MGQTLGERTREFDKAHNDANSTGVGWLKVCPNGDTLRIDPRDIVRTEEAETNEHRAANG